MLLPGLVYDLKSYADTYQISGIQQNLFMSHTMTPAGFVCGFLNRKVLVAGSGMDQLHQLTLQISYTMDN